MEAITKNKNSKTTKIIYWVSTGFLALFLLSGIFFINSKMAIEGMHHLSVPEWFRWELSIGHIIAGFLLILPVGNRIKEWNYVALGIDYISAAIAYISIDGAVITSFIPVVDLAILVVSYISYHKLHKVFN